MHNHRLFAMSFVRPMLSLNGKGKSSFIQEDKVKFQTMNLKIKKSSIYTFISYINTNILKTQT